MQTWREQNPQQAAERARARAREGERRRVWGFFQGTLASCDQEQMEQQIVAVVRAALQAAKLVRVGGSGGAPFQFLRVPDHQLRLKAARFVLAYTEGLPVSVHSTDTTILAVSNWRPLW